MDRSDMIFKLLTDLNKKQDDQSENLIQIKADLKYHIRRTDLIEDKLNNTVPKPTLRQIATIIGIIASVVGLAISLKVL